MSKKLTAKQVRLILKDEKNCELKAFISDFHDMLADMNSTRVVNHDRDIEYRRLDAIARLLVGNEICAAIAINEGGLVIATNINDHETNNYLINSDLLMRYEFPYINQEISENYLDFNIHPTLHYWIQKKNDLIVKDTCVLPDIISYKFDVSSAKHTIKSDKLLKINVPLSSIPLLGDITIKYTFNTNIEFSFFQQIYYCSVNNIQGRMTSTDIFTNPLKNRVEALFDHLCFVARAKSYQKEHNNEDTILKAKQVIDQHQERVLTKSLTMEASKWYKSLIPNDFTKSNYDITNAGNVKAFNEFLRELIKDFHNYTQNNLVEETTKMAKEWSKLVINKVESNELSIPNFMKEPESRQSVEHFFKKAIRYFIDITKLTKYIEEEVDKGTKLASLLLDEKFGYKKNCVKIIDSFEEDIHAELRVLSYTKDQPVNYIATSKLCCALCNLVLTKFGIGKNGQHAKAYPDWVLSKDLTAPDNLNKILGDTLYKKYQQLSDKEFSFDHKKYSGSELALNLLVSTATLNRNDFKNLGFNREKIWSNHNEDYPEESDDEKIAEHNDISPEIIGENPSSIHVDQL